MVDLKFYHQFEPRSPVALHLVVVRIHAGPQPSIEIFVTLAMVVLHLFETPVISPLPSRPRAAGPQLSSHSFLVGANEPPLHEDWHTVASQEHLAACRSYQSTLRQQSAPTEIFFESISSWWDGECFLESRKCPQAKKGTLH